MTADDPGNLESFPEVSRFITSRSAEEATKGGQLFASIDGQPVIDVAWSSGGVDVAPTDPVQWASSTKVTPAIAIAQVWEQGLIRLDDPVEQYIPEYSANGKAGITIRHLLTHTSGLVDLPPPTFITKDREEVLAMCCAAGVKPDWVRGRMASYGGSGPFLLGEIVSRVDGRPFDKYIREAILEPLDMYNCWVGMPVTEFDKIAGRVRHRWQQSREGEIFADTVWTARENIHRCSPGGGGIGPIRELAHTYEMLLGHGERDGVRLLTPQTVEAVTAAHRVGMGIDVFRGTVRDMGLLLYRDSKHVTPDDPQALYGQRCSPRTYGHAGAGGVNAFGDPEAGLAVAMYTPGPNAGAISGGAVCDLATALYSDLDIDLA